MNELTAGEIINALKSIEIAISNQDSLQSAVFSSVVAGVAIFILSEILKNVFIQPLLDYQKLKRKIEFTLIMYAPAYQSPVLYETIIHQTPFHNAAGTALRECAAELHSFSSRTILIPFDIPKKKCLQDAAKGLMGLSNSLYLPLKSHEKSINITQAYIEDVTQNLKICLDHK